MITKEKLLEIKAYANDDGWTLTDDKISNKILDLALRGLAANVLVEAVEYYAEGNHIPHEASYGDGTYDVVGGEDGKRARIALTAFKKESEST